MLPVDAPPHSNSPLIDTLTTLSLSAFFLLLLPLTLIAAVADCLWFRLRTALHSPQRPKRIWEF